MAIREKEGKVFVAIKESNTSTVFEKDLVFQSYSFADIKNLAQQFNAMQ